IGTLETINHENRDILRKVYEGTYNDLINTIEWDMSEFHTTDQDSQAEIDQQNFDKAQSYYKQCMNTDAIDAQGPTPVYPLITKILDAFIPLSSSEKTLNIETFTTALMETVNQSVSSLFSAYVEPDDKHPDSYAIKLSQAHLTLPKNYYSDPGAMKLYRQSMIHLLNTALGNENNNDNNSALRLQKAKEAKLKLLSRDEVNAIVDRVINLEIFVASISLDPDQMQDPRELYNPMTIHDLQVKYPIVNWEKLIGCFIEEGTPQPEYVIVNVPAFFGNLTSWLAPSISSSEKGSQQSSSDKDSHQTIADVQAIKDFFMVKTLIKWTYALDTATRQAWQPVTTTILSGTTEYPPRYDSCVSYTEGTMGMIQGRYYAMRKFGGKNERDKLEASINIVHDTLLNILAGCEWLDKPTLEAAIDKANKIKTKVAYNIASPDEREPEQLQKYYSSITISDESFLATELSATKWGLERARAKIGKPVDKDEWDMSPDTVNAYYNLINNEIVILAGIAQAPIYQSDAPDYLKYGSLGYLVGHELTHAFDRYGRFYDGDGILTEWWTPETTKHYDELSQCFITQYNNYTFSGPDGKVVHLNGKLSLGENIADNGGVIAGYHAFQQVWNGGELVNGQKPKHEKLPGIDLSPEALFFVNYGITWCSARRPESAVSLATSDTHALEQYRIIGPLQNFPEFSKVFQCPVGSPMNPQKKCAVW
ncbi:hypothetical protein INT45_006587, partial [Circinella minor]